ncbi:MAG: 3-demethylubiquinone-9 3-O-methyltransferase [Planctomycetes bacterium]|nr:3-demethylubiquinone-9 3-O-methyltransferase [Planctomycetota bacterium]MCB9869148.1 3-demethylubiquinone-9 3-O-methyltransferase [Planctomycetota bacterium]MCB9889016.1 3-demethylubiquinone-9 3-O-methyltransferase [Planctomycetota bacterium]
MARQRHNDLEIYDRHGRGWWDEHDRTFASLRSVAGFRRGVLESWLPRGVAGLRVVDLGCGGGLWAVPLAESGANVVGVDRSLESLRTALQRASHRCRFVRADLNDPPLADGCADLVVLADVIEHLDDPQIAVYQAARLLVPGGLLYVSTLNRTRRAGVLAVALAEGLGLIPRGTHDPKRFVRPEALDDMAGRCGLRRQNLQGEALAWWPTLRRWAVVLRRGRSSAVSYAALFRKPEEPCGG